MKEILNRTDAENQIFSFFNGKHFRFTSVEVKAYLFKNLKKLVKIKNNMKLINALIQIDLNYIGPPVSNVSTISERFHCGVLGHLL